MKLVIDIDDEDYKQIQDINSAFNGFTARLYSTIRKGTPLPKSHGRLIDADAMQKYQIDTFGKRLLVIDTAPTIIERDDS